jgi:lytic murein transglycosylase
MVTRGRELAIEHRDLLGRIEATYHVPARFLLAVWGMETRYGRITGRTPVFQALATLAWEPRRADFFRGELFQALMMVDRGYIGASSMTGSWAGAMGQTQFMPAAFRQYAVDGDGDGKRDIWHSAPDSLASAASLLVRGGWRRGETWAREVVLPADFDWGLSEGPKQPPNWWEAKGAKRADGLKWREADAGEGAVLMLPSGLRGPAFLLFPNHFAIRTYNNSSAYALGVGLLADRFGGGGPTKTPWPKETPLSLTERMDAQSALARLGFNPGQPDGVVGLGTRQALRAWQKARGLPADGYLSPEMVLRLRDEIAVPKPRA